MENTLDDLFFEFQVMIETATSVEDLSARRNVLLEAGQVLAQARTAWQNDLKKLQSGIETLRTARHDLLKEAVARHDLRLLSHLGFKDGIAA